MIRAVVFDLDGVYFSDSAADKFINAISLKFNVDADSVKKIFPKSDIMYEYRKGNISGDKFWHDAVETWTSNSTIKQTANPIKNIGSKTKTLIQKAITQKAIPKAIILKEINDIIKKVYTINKPVKNAVMKLRKKGILTVACSNNFKERIDALEEKFNFLKEFDYCFLSYEHHMLKPKLFEKVFEQINKNNMDNLKNKRSECAFKNKIAKDEILIIDDVKRITDAAKQMGFKTILCEDADKIDEYMRNAGISLD
ncbi:hypothetical protein HY636_05270 [Candidatus Woesearchaeota archaeon]|nr:hypothetical protein [Candidatus Woesearchaeota archaeon]